MIAAVLAYLIQDTLDAHLPLDTVIVESPAPGIQPVFELFLNMAQPLQIGLAVFLLAAVAVAGFFGWRHRRGAAQWFTARARWAQITLVAVLATLVLSFVGIGAATYDYVQHENAFCNSCHVMNEAYMRFAGSEHSDLGCHDCHRQPITASLRQLVLWVADRPEEIGPHSPVPTEVCGECHLQWRPDTLWMTEKAWRNVALTAGHSIHLESDSLPDMQCTACHGVSVHRFIPVESTCLTSGCHEGLEIRLGRMARAPVAFHCAGCHEFTARSDSAAQPKPGDAAERAISPTLEQCYSCHQMENVLPRAAFEKEPHEAACGLCHDPHTQVRVEEAAGSCATAGCHDDAAELTPFHRGLHVDVQTDCIRCHAAHTFKVDGDNCLACHTDIFSRRGRTR